jgi:peptide/nickel transport system substrate-binding protein
MKKTALLSLFALCLGLLAPVADPHRVTESAEDNTLTIALLKEPMTLDIDKIFIAVEEHIVADLGATLIAADPDTGEPVPYLATSWSVSEDGLVWTFHLRDDVRFHDGTPLTAEEYVWTINRILSLTGPESFVPQALLSSVTGAKAVDPYTLELDLRSPNATLLYNLESTFLQPLSPQAVESAGDDYGRHPVGVGPFRFKEWVPGQRIVLERNPDFTWGPPFTSGGPAKLDRIEYDIIPNYDLALVELLEGQIDALRVEHVDARRVLENGDLTLVPVTVAGSPLYLALNMTKPPLDDLRVRQALNDVVDRNQLISIVEYGYGEPQYGPVSPVTIGAWPGAEEAGYHTDPAKAQALLADVGYEWNDEGLLVKTILNLSCVNRLTFLK